MFFSRPGPYTPERYADCFERSPLNRKQRVFGEASTTYLSVPPVAARIAGTIGHDVRIVVVLRNPVQRAISAYWHMAKRFHETRSVSDVFDFSDVEFDSVIQSEKRRVIEASVSGQIVTSEYEQTLGDGYWPYRYLRNSLYLEDLKRFEHIFGAERLLILLTDDVHARPYQTYRQLANFLGIQSSVVPKAVGSRHNVTRISPQTRLMRTLVRSFSALPFLGQSVSWRIRNAFSEAPPKADPCVEVFLNIFFRPHVKALSEYLHRDLSMWSADTSGTGRLSQQTTTC